MMHQHHPDRVSQHENTIKSSSIEKTKFYVVATIKHSIFSYIAAATPPLSIALISLLLYHNRKIEVWKLKNAFIISIFLLIVLILTITPHIKRNFPLFQKISLWVIIAFGTYTTLSGFWGGYFRAGLESNGELSFKDLLSSTLTAVGGIGAVGYLVIKYREQVSIERDDDRKDEESADKKIQNAIQQLGSESPQVCIAGAYALADIANTRRESHHQRITDILCGYLRTEHNEAVESTIFSIFRENLASIDAPNHEDNPWSSCKLDLQGSKIIGNLDLSYLHIGEINCDNAHFAGKATFSESRFTETTTFRGTIFTGNASFQGAHFKKDAIFRGTYGEAGPVFYKDADFRMTTFERAAIFQKDNDRLNELEKGVPVWPSDGEYEPTEFGDATFKLYADFRKAVFIGPALFETTIFNDSEKTTFKGAHFNPLYLGTKYISFPERIKRKGSDLPAGAGWGSFSSDPYLSDEVCATYGEEKMELKLLHFMILSMLSNSQMSRNELLTRLKSIKKRYVRLALDSLTENKHVELTNSEISARSSQYYRVTDVGRSHLKSILIDLN